MKVLIAMECSGIVRDAFRARGHDAWSCDLKPSERPGPHLQGDVWSVLPDLRARGWWPDLAIWHPDCTYLTIAAEWAYGDGPYHQQVKPETLVGAPRREARARALAEIERIWRLPIDRVCIENPRGVINSRLAFMPAPQIIQPYEFGDDASKATCLWLRGLSPLKKSPAQRVPGRLVPRDKAMGKSDRDRGCQGPEYIERWSNQSDSGQNRLPPSASRAADRARTYWGPALAMAAQWGVQSELRLAA